MRHIYLIVALIISCFLAPISNVFAADHPQILFSPGDISTLRQKVGSGAGLTTWNSMKWFVDYRYSFAYPTAPIDRYSTQFISRSAMAYLITGDTKYAAKTKDWIMYFVNNISDWNGGYGNGGSSYTIHDIVLAYDWIYSWWVNQPNAATEIQALRNRLLIVVPTIDLPISQGGCGNRHRSYEAIGLAGYALMGEVPEAEAWIAKAKTWFAKYISPSGYGTDGFWADGPAYGGDEQAWRMGLFFSAAAFHQDNFWNTEWSKNQQAYWSYLWTGATKTYDYFPYSDNYSYADIAIEVLTNTNGGINNIGYHIGDAGPSLLSFAHLYHDPIMYSLANEQTAKDSGRYYWDPSILWFYDPSLTPQSPAGQLPLSHYFNDFEAVVGRSDWTANGTQFYMKTGVNTGKVGFQNSMFTESYEGHAQTDANAINIYSRGEWLVTKDAYTTPRYTKTQSTILSDGGGQIHDGEMWGSIPHSGMESMGLRSVLDIGPIFYTVGDATSGYDNTKLNQFDRHVVYFRPDIFVVFDEVGHTSTHRYDWMLQMEYDKTAQVLGNNQFRVVGSRTADLDITFIKPNPLSVEQGTHVISRCTNISKTSPCEISPVVSAPYISFYPSTNLNKTQFLAILEAKTKGAASHPVTPIPATNGQALSVGPNNYCLTADLNATSVSLGPVTTTGRVICWQGNLTQAENFIAGPTQHFNLPPYSLTATTATISIGLNGLTGEISTPVSSQITLNYPNLTGILIDHQPVSFPSFTLNPGRHSLEIIVGTPSPLPGDLNSDGLVDYQDFLYLLPRFSNPFNIFDFNSLTSLL